MSYGFFELKLAFVVHRCGQEIIGGSESFCLNLATKLSKFFETEILTTCALDYMTWKNHYKSGLSVINGISIRRFETDFERDVDKFNAISNKVLLGPHSIDEEIHWMKMQGPYSTSLLQFLQENKDRYDVFIFITYLYATTFFGLPLVSDKSILIPAADADLSLQLSIYDEIFRTTRGIVYQTEEEKNLLVKRFAVMGIPNKLINQGVDEPMECDRNLKLRNLDFPFALYLGRIDESKGCRELLEYFSRFKKETRSPIKLVLAGPKIFEFEENDNIIYLGVITKEEKACVLNKMSFFIMPSKHESFSMVTMEAWSYKKPVIVNAKSDVVKGHCERSNGGLYYDNYEEFVECINLLDSDENIGRKLGENGYRYVKNNYTWEKMIDEYRDFIHLVKSN